ncbi:MAG: GDP-L-fucose synthase [Patescibacteria group bacterium]|nr:GDP-L-fucose synthase [Patescibacteria group bacterium]
MFFNNKKILLTGGVGFLGSCVVEKLISKGVKEENIIIPRSREYDLRDRSACDKLVDGVCLVIHCAAKVGGIGFNKEHAGEVFYDNAAMALNLINAAYRAGAEKFVGIGSVCEYPKYVPIPFKEEDLWIGYPEEINAPYGLAKKMMLAQSQAYRKEYGFNAIHLLIINLYGPGDNFNPKSSHVIPALIKKVFDAKKEKKNFIEVWGTGKASREFLYVEDAAEGIILATENYNKEEPVNLGSGMEITIKDLVELICRLMDFKGEIRWDASKPDGQPRRCLDVSRAEKEFGFGAKTDFKEGLKKTIDWYVMKNN